MAAPKQKSALQQTSIRVSVTFPRDQYELLERLARDKKVSVAWVTRDAVEKYLTEQWPLLQTGGRRIR
jgi:predicted DNA-binding protein